MKYRFSLPLYVSFEISFLIYAEFLYVIPPNYSPTFIFPVLLESLAKHSLLSIKFSHFVYYIFHF